MYKRIVVSHTSVRKWYSKRSVFSFGGSYSEFQTADQNSRFVHVSRCDHCTLPYYRTLSPFHSDGPGQKERRIIARQIKESTLSNNSQEISESLGEIQFFGAKLRVLGKIRSREDEL